MHARKGLKYVARCLDHEVQHYCAGIWFTPDRKWVSTHG